MIARKANTVIFFVIFYIIVHQLAIASNLSDREGIEQLLPHNPKPRILIEDDLCDFGEMTGGSKVEHTFKLRNIGNDILEIKKIEHPCRYTATIRAKT